MLLCTLTLLLPTTWIVDAAAGPGTNFVDLPAAIAAAVDGDTIFVRAGSYTGFDLQGKALTIRGAGVGATSIGDATPGQSCKVGSTPAGATVVLSGVRFHGTSHALVVDGGHVALLHCRLEGAAAFVSGRQGLSHFAGEVEAVECTFVGGDCTGTYPAFPGAVGGTAVAVQSGAFAADRCSFTGGACQVPPYLCGGGSAVVTYGARVRLDRCSCSGGYGLTNGGVGVSCLSNGLVRVCGDAASQIAGGTNPGGVRNVGLSSLTSATGVEVHGPVTVLGGTSGTVALGLQELPRLTIAGALLPSGDTDAVQPVTVTLDGLQPSLPCLFAIGLKPLFQVAVPPVVGDLLLDVTALAVFPGVLDTAGRYQFTFVPALVFGGSVPFPVYSQGAVLDAAGQLPLSNCDGRFFTL